MDAHFSTMQILLCLLSWAPVLVPVRRCLPLSFHILLSCVLRRLAMLSCSCCPVMRVPVDNDLYDHCEVRIV